MSQSLVIGLRHRGALFVLHLFVGCLALSMAAATGNLTGTAAAATPKEKVSYYTFRTRDTGAAATNEQNTRCNNYFGARALTTVTRLNALLFAFNADPGSGRLVDQTANLLGPGFICAVPKLSTEEVDAYAYSSLPGPGLVEATGPCGLQPVAVNGSPLILNCALGVKPIPAKNVLGGLITSNSLVNILDRSENAPTGSVWTAQVVGDVANTGGGGGTVPPTIKPDTPGLDFYSMRARDEKSVSPSSFDCTVTGLAGPAIAVRTANLAVAQPDATSGKVPDAVGPAVGKLTVCYVRQNANGSYRAFGLAELKAAGKTIKVTARGDCRTTSTVAGPGLRGQACALAVRKATVQAGLITSNGLIDAGAPASSADHAVWTFAMFGVPSA
ncbi:MAG: hypothetical protein J7513_13550 [Solirubrobacteraceae bacterium]|nr:hypothetical protein [Solirubrobacteraceae bacterium]